jgi:hypothetical protein
VDDVVDELALVREYFGDPPEDRGATERARARLRARAGRPRRAVWRLVAVAAALGLTLLAALTLTLGGQASAAARALTALSLRAGEVPLVSAAGEAVVYERMDRSHLVTATTLDAPEVYTYRVESRVEIWRASDGSVLARERVLGTSFVTPEDEATWERLGRPPIPTPGDVVETLPPDADVPLPVLGGLPSEPHALLEAIRERWVPYVPTTNEQLLLAVAELLARGDADPGLRADLFRAAAEIPDIELLGTVEDAIGRQGVGLGLGPPDRRVKLVVARETSFLLSLQESRTSEGSTAFDESVTYLEWATVDRLGERPESVST